MRKLRNDELGRISAEDYKSAEKNPIVLVLDNVRSMNNTGSAFRTADAFGVERLVLCGITATPPHREINKTALGATESVPWSYEEDTLRAIEQLKAQGYRVVSVEQADQSVMLPAFEANTGEKLALVFGNEIKGVDEEVVSLSDVVIEIPQYGSKHSLNISVSIGVVLWDILSKLRFYD
jgi:tRNA G18 (ribose-2'-O)-methylase SpoU